MFYILKLNLTINLINLIKSINLIKNMFIKFRANLNICIIYNNMPAQIFMNLNNGNYSKKQIAAFQAKMASVPKPKAQPLNASIIGRIHNVRPGCGSCGK
jgi:hypothetical protein